ncbi:MAG TPA: hypothetical protein DGK91_00650 [Clostridium sp.]|jgi:hypothetical protein|nr:hypothetical protein [Clostridium sp.]
MKVFDPEKLYVEFRPGVTKTEPILGRKYTLTHSDISAELFLTVGLEFAYDKITSIRDELLVEWLLSDRGLIFYAYIYLGEFDPQVLATRDAIFRRELPLALEAIIYGDREFFYAHPQLENAPICIYFDSTDPNYRRYEYWGTVKDYKKKEAKAIEIKQ